MRKVNLAQTQQFDKEKSVIVWIEGLGYINDLKSLGLPQMLSAGRGQGENVDLAVVSTARGIVFLLEQYPQGISRELRSSAHSFAPALVEKRS